ncbi:hypothetical protein ACJX0J_019142, partial [Zea mays]
PDADERRGAVHAGGRGAHRRRGRGAGGVHERVHARVHPRRRLGGRPPGPPPHPRARQRLPHGRRARHVARHQLRRAHGGALRHQRRLRVRARRRPRVQRRDIAGGHAWRPLIHARHIHQRRHPAQLRVQLRVRGPPGAHRVASHVRHRRHPARAHRRRGARHHARVTAVARDAGPPRRRARGAVAHVGQPGRRRLPARGDQASRRRAVARCCGAPRWRRCLEGALRPAIHHNHERAARPRLRPRAAVLRAGVRRRRHPPLQPAGLQGGRRGVHLRRARRHRVHRSRQDVLRPRRHALHRPPRPAPAPPRQHRRRRRDRDRPRRDAVRGHGVAGDGRGVPGVRAGLRGRVLHRLRVRGVDVQRG